jgi:hypothetical protein
MHRQMIQCNTELFSHLVQFCVDRGEVISDPRAVRYVSLNRRNREQNIVKHATLDTIYRFGRRRALVSITHEGRRYAATLGFEFETETKEATLATVSLGFHLLVWSQLRPFPRATAPAVRNIVEAADGSDPDYAGHAVTAIDSVLPALRLYELVSASVDDDWRSFLILALEECRLGEFWLDDQLTHELQALARLKIAELPYESLCRAVFDWDQTALYMALYRCIEATYAYETTRQVVSHLGIAVTWRQMASALETEVGWHPREAESLRLVLRHANQDDLRAICTGLGTAAGDNDLAGAAASAIYRLRNAIVHYRPGASCVQRDEYDWNDICVHMTRIVFHVFTQAYVPA